MARLTCILAASLLASIGISQEISNPKPFHVGDDPADSWLAYAVSKGNGKKVTYVNMTWNVPALPTQRVAGNAPGWWFGIEPDPASYLIQPILAWGYGGVQYTIFNGYYEWPTDYWWSSKQGPVKPGNTIFASVRYNQATNAYDMLIQCNETGWSVKSSIPVKTQRLYTDVYVVFEHQPDNCKQLASDGQIIFKQINIELDGKPVTPSWQPFQYKPACNSQAVVIDSTSVKFTWDTKEDSNVNATLVNLAAAETAVL
jgi:hypothetical protein